MKYLLSASLLFLTCIQFSCKKSNDANNSINWKEELKGSLWAGQFKYTTGDYTGLQAFSIEMNGDGTTTWSDAGSTRPGGTWKIDGNSISLTFPNGSSLSATVSKEAWTDFTNPVANGFKINTLSRSFKPVQANFLNTTWKGRYEDDATVVSVKFLDGVYIDKLNYTNYYKGSNTYILPYTIEGAGIRFTITDSKGHGYYHYLTFENASSIRGMYYSAYQLFFDTYPLFRPLTLTKQ